MTCDPTNVAAALAQLFPNCDPYSFLKNPRFASRDVETSIWSEIGLKIKPCTDKRTLRKIIRRCYDTFRNKFPEIAIIYKKLIAVNEKHVGSDIEVVPVHDEDCLNNSLPETHLSDFVTPLDIDINDTQFAQADENLDVHNIEITRNEHSFEDAFNSDWQCDTNNNSIENVVPLLNLNEDITSKRPTNGNNQRKRCSEWIQDEPVLIPENFWIKYWSFNRQLRIGWADAFIDYVKQVERYRCCVFRVKYHRCYQSNEVRNFYFYTAIECKNSSCCEYKFATQEKIQKPFKSIKIMVRRNRAIQHDGTEIHRRFIRGDRRNKYGVELLINKPSVVRTLKIQEVPLNVLEAGNRDEAPSLTILQKISSENETKKDLATNPTEHLELLSNMYKNQTKWEGKTISGYIQNNFTSIAFTEKQLLYLLSLAAKNRVFCYLDATGSIVANSPQSNKRIFYYALVLPGSTRDQYGPLPVAEFLSDTHTVPQITYFLSTVNHAIKQYTTRKVSIQKIETDFSIALIASALKSFNDITISRYLMVMYAFLKADNKKLPELTIIHICSTHAFKTVIRKSKTMFSSKENRKLVAIVMSKLIHADTMEAAAESFRIIVIIFASRYDIPILETCKKYFKINVKSATQEEILARILDEIDSDKNDEDDRLDVELKNDLENDGADFSGRKGSPFFKFFESKYQSTLIEISEEESQQLAQNPNLSLNHHHSEEFLNYLLTYILPYYPLWSAVILSHLNLLRDSNATVENYFKIIKNNVFQKKTNIPAPRFIRRMESMIYGWLLERNYSLITDRQCKRRKKDFKEAAHEDENLAIEQFKKANPKRRKQNLYFPTEKYVKSSEQNQKNQNQVDICNNLISSTSNSNIDSIIKPIISSEEQYTAGNYTTFLEDANHRFFNKNLTYPPNFPYYEKDFAGIRLNAPLFKRLYSDNWLDGEIINSFFITLQEIAQTNNLNLLCFDTYFTEKLLAGKKSVGFTNWAKKVKPSQFDLWLLPVFINNNHWVLLVVIFSHRVMIYLDSCHRLPPEELINRICSFIASSRDARSHKLTHWQDWSISAPIDTPEQRDEQGNISGNCGVHVCMWAYAIASSSKLSFEEQDMATARKGLARFLIDFPITKISAKRIETFDALLKSYDTIPDLKHMLRAIPTSRDPPLGFQSTSGFVESIKALIDIASS